MRKSTVDRNIADINKMESKGNTIKECRYYLKSFYIAGDGCRFSHREVCGVWRET